MDSESPKGAQLYTPGCSQEFDIHSDTKETKEYYKEPVVSYHSLKNFKDFSRK